MKQNRRRTQLLGFLGTGALFVGLSTLAVTNPAFAGPVGVGIELPPLDPCELNPNLCIDICDTHPEFCDDPVPENAAADLRIIDVYRGDDCAVTVVVENVGNLAAGPFDVDIFFDRAAPPEIGDLAAHYLTTGGIAAGTTVEVAVPIPAGYSGPHNVSALVDTVQNIDESNEHNNMWYRCGTLEMTCLI